jgi:hypothetical protein
MPRGLLFLRYEKHPDPPPSSFDMRLRLTILPQVVGVPPQDFWIAGHPDYAEQEWTGCQGAVWSPSRTGAWLSGSGHERAGFEDGGNAAFSLSFEVTRTFATARAVAAYITSLHSRQPPHPWSGLATIRYDREDGGAVEINAGDCVLQLAGPVQSLGGTGQLAVVIPYVLHGGVLGAQPTYVDPVNPVNPPVPPGYEDYDYEAILPSLPD